MSRARSLAPKHDAQIISTVSELMGDRHTGVCCTAVQVLSVLSAGDAKGREAIAAHRTDRSRAVRAAVAFVLDQ